MLPRIVAWSGVWGVDGERGAGILGSPSTLHLYPIQGSLWFLAMLLATSLSAGHTFCWYFAGEHREKSGGAGYSVKETGDHNSRRCLLIDHLWALKELSRDFSALHPCLLDPPAEPPLHSWCRYITGSGVRLKGSACPYLLLAPSTVGLIPFSRGTQTQGWGTPKGYCGPHTCACQRGRQSLAQALTSFHLRLSWGHTLSVMLTHT